MQVSDHYRTVFCHYYLQTAKRSYLGFCSAQSAESMDDMQSGQPYFLPSLPSLSLTLTPQLLFNNLMCACKKYVCFAVFVIYCSSNFKNSLLLTLCCQCATNQQVMYLQPQHTYPGAQGGMIIIQPSGAMTTMPQGYPVTAQQQGYLPQQVNKS